MTVDAVKSQATEYAEKFGISVIPLWRGKKKPCVPSWRDAQEKRAAAAEIQQWRRCNVGIVTGKLSGVIVVDCESREDAKWFWKTRGKTPLVVLTPRGVHLYFRHPGHRIPNTVRVKDKNGRSRFDVRGDGGFVVAPPSSVVADGEDITVGGAYRFNRGGMIHPGKLPLFDPSWAPQPVCSSATAGDARAIRDVQRYISRIHAVSGEGGHAATYRVACLLREAGLGEGESLLALLRWNATNAHPPWSDRELLHKVRWVSAKGGNVRQGVLS